METIFGFLLPFFLTAAGGNPDTARAAIRQLIAAYNATTATELDLAARIVGFSIAALDNLRLSMTADLSDTKVLRYRANAVTLGRASDQARKALEAIRANPDQPYKTPRPTVAPAPDTRSSATPSSAPSSAAPSLAAATRAAAPDAVPPDAVPPDAVPLGATASAPARITTAAQISTAQITTAQTMTAAKPAQPPQPPFSIPPLGQSPLALGGATKPRPVDIEAMKRDARVLLNEFSKHSAPSATSIPTIADPAAMARAAARAAVAAHRPNPGKTPSR